MVKKKSILRGAVTGGLLAVMALGTLASPVAASAADVSGWSGTGDTRTAAAAGATARITVTDKMQVKSSGAAVNLATVRDGGELGLNIIGLPEGFPCAQGKECVRGSVIIDFGQRVTNPKIKLGNLGGDVFTSPGNSVNGTAKYTLRTAGVSLSSVAGNLDVTGTTITSNDFGAKNGTVRVNGTVSRVEFQVTMRSKASFFGLPVWTKVPSDLHSIDLDIDAPTKPVLTIDKNDQQTDVTLGQSLTYDIVVKNTGNGTATNVVVSDPLPDGLDFVSGSGPGGTTVTASGRTISAAVGSLAPGASATLKVNATVNPFAAPGALTNQACVIATNAAKVCDDDVDIVKRGYFQYTFNHTPGDPKPGDTVTYRLEYSNNGNVDSANAEIAFGIGQILDDSTWNPSTLSASSGAVSFTGDTIDWKGPLAQGAKAVVTFTGEWNGEGDGLAFPDVSYYGEAR